MEFLSVKIFSKVNTCLGREVKCKLKELLSVYLMFLDYLIFFFTCMEKSCCVFKSTHQQQGVGSVTDVWGKGTVSTLRQEGITCGPWKEFGKDKEVCQIEIGKDEEQRYICCVLPSPVPCPPTRASSFPWCSPWKYLVESGAALYYCSEIVVCVINSISAAEFKIKPPHIEWSSNLFLFLN